MQDSFLNSEQIPKFRFTAGVSYLGQRYCGWQIQPLDQSKLTSIQEVIETALFKITGQVIRIQGSGRTDSGVNATGQVIHFDVTGEKWSEEIFFQAMNSLLPIDIRFTWVRRSDAKFHAQKSAIKKQYSYYYLQGPTALPWFDGQYCWHRNSLNPELMHQAVIQILGEHDFIVFQARGAKPDRSTVRSILEASVERIAIPATPQLISSDYSLIRIRLVGTGFLKQMVRSIAGTLRQVGEGQRPSSTLMDLVASKIRADVGPTAPANGLWLEQVWYP